jgi:hypothetical protein
MTENWQVVSSVTNTNNTYLVGSEQECPIVTESPTRQDGPVIHMQNHIEAETLTMSQANTKDEVNQVTCLTHQPCPAGYTVSDHMTSSCVSTSQTPSMASSHISTNGHQTETVAAVHTIQGVGGKTECSNYV